MDVSRASWYTETVALVFPFRVSSLILGNFQTGGDTYPPEAKTKFLVSGIKSKANKMTETSEQRTAQNTSLCC